MASCEETVFYHGTGSEEKEGFLLCTPNPRSLLLTPKHELVLLVVIGSTWRVFYIQFFGILVSLSHLHFSPTHPGYGPNFLVMLVVSGSAKFETVLVKYAPSRLANLKIRAFRTRKDFLAPCVSSLSCSWIFQFVA